MTAPLLQTVRKCVFVSSLPPFLLRCVWGDGKAYLKKKKIERKYGSNEMINQSCCQKKVDIAS